MLCFITDETGLANRGAINIDNITWECDYPHSDSTWPRAPEALFQQMKGIPDDEIDKITHLNAMGHFSYDPFCVIPREECTASALGTPPPDVINEIRATGRLVAALSGTVPHALAHAEAGVDVIVAQGHEADAHCGEIGSIALWQQVVDAVERLQGTLPAE